MLGRARGGDLWILREVLVEQTYTAVLSLLPTKPLRVVDVGAHIGAFTIWLGQQRKVREAFCFEPDPDSFRLSQFNFDANGCDYVSLHKKAFGGTARDSDIWINPIAHARSSLYSIRVSDPRLYGRSRRQSSVRQHSIQVLAFHEWLNATGGTFDLLKMDCEGAEWEMLDACPEAFARFSVIVAEVHDDPKGLHERQDFGEVLTEHGFKTIEFGRLYIGCRV